MTATRDRRSDAGPDPRWALRSAFSDNGIPWWAAALLAFGVSAVIALIAGPDGFLFSAFFFLSCAAAAVMVQRIAIFGPMVQPPLVMVGAVPIVVLLSGSGGEGLSGKALSIGKPLIESFPTMALTTAVTVGVGVYRMFKERAPLEDDVAEAEPRRSSRPSSARPTRDERREDRFDERGRGRDERGQGERGRDQRVQGDRAPRERAPRPPQADRPRPAARERGEADRAPRPARGQQDPRGARQQPPPSRAPRPGGQGQGQQPPPRQQPPRPGPAGGRPQRPGQQPPQRRPRRDDDY
ncbi:hypothetical protein NLX83_05260 [Allokutzneria sp. A3M-2-11 16]|uniref:DUF6542 domain-containing protein n=1 Tax=Allokutzneria sp. A3M-2-11 16 TaxID=2962043 RepID=UPI0020B85BEE|nr:DUF6542 domain-containing protein [Allokutzneria sp. A3M-2-11 16]MCP3798662.1 hypothetical protein [Allokutzneria sp. A3M-2-11 16]